MLGTQPQPAQEHISHSDANLIASFLMVLAVTSYDPGCPTPTMGSDYQDRVLEIGLLRVWRSVYGALA